MMNKKLIALAMAGVISVSGLAPMVSFADSAPIVTIGADLTEEQKQEIYNFFNVDQTKVVIVEVNNAQERQYLEGLVPDSIIGTKTLSCSYILPTDEGGILVKTANLTYVTDGMIANALLTAGIENCQVICTAPFPVSGTGALTGVLSSYEKSSGITLDEEKKALATEELVVTGEIVDEAKGYVAGASDGVSEADVLSAINDIKTEVMNSNLSKEEIDAIVKRKLLEYGIELTEETYNKLINYLSALTGVQYDSDIKEKLEGLSSKIKNGFDFSFTKEIKVERGFFSKLWAKICNFFISIFGGEEVNPDYKITTEDVDNIFEDVNTEVYEFDDSVSAEDTSADEVGNTEVEESAIIDTTIADAEVPSITEEEVSNTEVDDSNSQEMTDLSQESGID